MIVTTNSIDIARPLEEVFEFLTEPQNYLLWQAGLISITATQGLEVGSRLSFQSVALGRGFEVEAKISANNHRDKIEAVSARGQFTFTSKYTLKEIPGGTRVRFSNRIDTHGIFHLAAGILQSMGEAKYRADLEQLKIVLEGNVVLTPAPAE